MNQRRWIKPILSSLLAFATLYTAGAQASPGDQPATLKTVTLNPVKVGGKWRIAWDVRSGTVRRILVLTRHAGTFEEYGKTQVRPRLAPLQSFQLRNDIRGGLMYAY